MTKTKNVIQLYRHFHNWILSSRFILTFVMFGCTRACSFSTVSLLLLSTATCRPARVFMSSRRSIRFEVDGICAKIENEKRSMLPHKSIRLTNVLTSSLPVDFICAHSICCSFFCSTNKQEEGKNRK